ncbi:Gfo/Idh/MocA family oxidoreductase [Halopenitus sp. POP-27]|uniref:Gfo/Idh/MocA family protein n=1 Tax=Halopenitus sp. POP-27 TaxID=2994425 RepID=UPI002468CB27|nr:Gfo/Idh/MocA family oxidoreductase [Halopenitus sp. POP-27]
MTDSSLSVGVIGVGSMGQHHARVYSELANADLIGVSDVDPDRAEQIATEYGTDALSMDELIGAVDAVSIAVPTEYHYEVARKCIENGVSILVEKPFVSDVEEGEELIELAEQHGVQIQVGHIERFNPAVEALEEIVPHLEVTAVDARRLGPDPDREIDDSVVSDLMIHDVDIVLSLIDSDIDSIQTAGTAEGRYATSTLTFVDDTISSLTASRQTQQKVRELTITADDRYVKVDYLDQSIEIHRQSAPEFITDDGSMKYRHESIVEHPVVENIEPLKNELQSFLEAVAEDNTPPVSGTDGLEAVKIIQEIDEQAFSTEGPNETVQ